ncbi:MAG: aldo/keto reductase [Dysgonamonadaceae bacterium]|jgi:predicted aldo/keto reductase-like oxidoreductase|nr:aldo/keto reductase [Dysgonamonadaceae bacterium]
MAKKNKKEINRRDFLKAGGISAVAATVAMTGCKPKTSVSSGRGSSIEAPTDKMTYRINHNTGDVVSLLGYGCMRWPLRQRADGDGEEVDQEAVNELVDYAIAHGVNYFDTAPVYVRGWSETATGIALKRHPREKFFVATKASNQRGNNTREGGIAMYERSMRELQVDYLDYYLLHNVGASLESFNDRFIHTGLLDYFLKEREAGRIRNLGWSFHGDVKVFDHILAMDVHWDFVQIQLNYQDWQHAEAPRNVNAEYLYAELLKKNVPVVIMEPLLGGRLARVPVQALTMMKEIRPDDTAAQWAFRYAGTPENVLSVLSGMVYMEHLQENIRTYSPLTPLNEQEYEMLEQATDILVDSDYIQCTECQYCMPCPYGLDIPGVFGHYNRCVSAGRILKNSNDDNYRKARREFLIGYDRSVPKLRQAGHCIACDQCLPKCPQRVNITQEMRRVDQYVEELRQK